MSIKTKLLSVIISTLAVVGLVMVSIIYWQITQKLTEHSNADIKNNINYSFQLINLYLGRVNDSVYNLANDPLMVEALTTKNPQKLKQISDKFTAIVNTTHIMETVALFEVNGVTCTSRTSGQASLPSTADRNYSDRDYCKGILKTKAPYLSSAYIGTATKHPNLALVIPVKNAQGKMIGFVSGVIDVSGLRGSLLSLQKDSSTVLLDRYGTRFLDTKKKLVKFDNPPSALVNEIKKRLASNQKEGYFKDGNNFIGYKFDGSMTVVYETSTTDLLALINVLSLTVLLAQIAGAFITGAVVYLIVGTIAGRISRLSLISQQIAGGKFDIKLEKKDLQSTDETAVLARAFDEMATKLASSYKDLEQKVRDRTQDLENANKASQNVLDDLSTEKTKLEEAEAKEEALLTSIGDGVTATDLYGKVILINHAAEALTGWSNQEVMGKIWPAVINLETEGDIKIPPDKRPIFIAIHTGKTTTTTGSSYFYVRKNGTKFPVAITVSPVIIGGKIIGAISVFRDITKEIEIEKAKTEFVSLASHQLRGPLTTISWYTEMILKGDVGKIIPGQKKYLEKIYQGDQRMVELVDALLNVSRIELGTFAPRPEPTDVVKLAQSVLDEQKPAIEKKKLIIKGSFSKNIPTLSADPKFLRMVLQNLLSNAVEYTPPGGKIELAISLENKKAILIKVSDTGYGIPKNQQDKIFTKLFRADNVRDKEIGGTGLGLYIVKSIVENSGGKIWFESKENKGTTFYVTLPLTKPVVGVPGSKS
ncbi:MAG TPA: ATP-binding protein [Patescibacteria group bacterium]|jgi:PAS domain S-box-containing protein|nr:ATP-binding protein [Patescibacteria group bacterium]